MMREEEESDSRPKDVGLMFHKVKSLDCKQAAVRSVRYNSMFAYTILLPSGSCFDRLSCDSQVTETSV